MSAFRRYLTREEERLLFGAVARIASPLARRDHGWMRLMRYTGIRVGAASQLTCRHAREALKSEYLELEPAIQKRKQGHRVFITRPARRALQDLLKVRREMGYIEADAAPLIMSRNHCGMSIRSFQARMRQWCREAGLDASATPHWLRHTLAKRMMKQSTAMDPRGVVKSALGHRSIASTSIYTEPDKEDVEQAMQEANC